MNYRKEEKRERVNFQSFFSFKIPQNLIYVINQDILNYENSI